MLGSVDGVRLREVVEEGVPLEAIGAVKEDDRRSGAGGLDACLDLVTPCGQRTVLGGDHQDAPPAGTASAGNARFARRLSGHQRSSHSSSQRSRTWGRTSREKRSMFLSVSSCGMEPMWRSTMRLPTRSSFIASVSWSRTVAGLPAITKPLSTKSLNVKFGRSSRMLRTSLNCFFMVFTRLR